MPYWRLYFNIYIYICAHAQPACVVTVFSLLTSLLTGSGMPPGYFLLVSWLTDLLADDILTYLVTFPDSTAASFRRTHSLSHEQFFFFFFLSVLNHPAAATLLTYSEGSKDRMCAEAISVALLNSNCCYHSLSSL